VSQAASGSCSSFPGTIFMALLTRMSMRPNSLIVVSARRAMSADFDTSIATPMLRTPALRMSAAVASAVCGSISATTTWAPSFA
jgi:hypothetical protein